MQGGYAVTEGVLYRFLVGFQLDPGSAVAVMTGKGGDQGAEEGHIGRHGETS